MPPEPAAELAVNTFGTVRYGDKTAHVEGAQARGLRWALARLSGGRRVQVSAYVRAVWEGEPKRTALRMNLYRINNVLRELGYPRLLLLDGDWLTMG